MEIFPRSTLQPESATAPETTAFPYHNRLAYVLSLVVRTTTEIVRSDCVFYEGRAVVQRTSLRLVFINKPHANARRTSNGNVVDYGVCGYPVNVSNNFRVCYCLGFFESIQPYRHTGSIGKRTLNRGFVAEEKYQTESHIEEIIRP